MRKFWVVLSVVGLAWLALAAIPSGPTSVTLGWDPEPGIDFFKLYASSNVAAPINTWTLLTNIPGTVVTPTNSYPQTNVQVAIEPGAMFFYLTASNLWGETGPSNITNTPPLPLATNLNIHR